MDQMWTTERTPATLSDGELAILPSHCRRKGGSGSVRVIGTVPSVTG